MGYCCKAKVATKLNKIPIKKAILNKNGQECIFLPSEKNKEAVAVLENDFKVTVSTSSPVKKILLKLKVCNLVNYCSEDKSELRTAILEKNVEVKECMENNESVVFEVLFITSLIQKSVRCTALTTPFVFIVLVIINLVNALSRLQLISMNVSTAQMVRL